MVILLVAAIMVLFIKALRLYIIMFGSKSSWLDFFKIYSKSMIVTILFPFKLGEIFRMYYFGRYSGNLLSGVVYILLDRFIDTWALVSLILVFLLVSHMQFFNILYLFIIFLVFSLVCYLIYPAINNSIKEFLIDAPATKRRIYLLRILRSFERIYNRISLSIKGKGVILYVMSIVAWIIEVGSLVMINKVNIGVFEFPNLSQYLSSSLISNTGSCEYTSFSIISILFLAITYFLIKLCSIFKSKEK